MKKRVGILTSGGDCPGLNATIRGVAKALYQRFGEDVEIIGIINGYSGLINGDWRVMQPYEFSGILTVGGTILGTKRTPFKLMRVMGDDNVDKVDDMKKNYTESKFLEKSERRSYYFKSRQRKEEVINSYYRPELDDFEQYNLSSFDN